MIKIEISNLEGIVTGRTIIDESEVDAFLFSIAASRDYGIPEHQELETPATYDEDGVKLTDDIFKTVASEYTVIQTDITAQLADEARKADLKAQGAAARIACQNALDLIGGHNLSTDLTPEQITTMTQTFAPILQNLSIGRPGAAKLLIQAIVPDNVTITAQLQSDVLAELTDY